MGATNRRGPASNSKRHAQHVETRVRKTQWPLQLWAHFERSPEFANPLSTGRFNSRCGAGKRETTSSTRISGKKVSSQKHKLIALLKPVGRTGASIKG